jgi:hypothetical protein
MAGKGGTAQLVGYPLPLEAVSSNEGIPMANPLCSVCQNSAALALVDRELLSGSTPAQIFREYGDSLKLSRSSVYRHAAGGHSLPATLDPRWVAGSTTAGMVIEDLESLRASLIEQRAAALERGQHAVANQTAQRIESVSVALLSRAGVDDEWATSVDKTNRQWFETLGYSIFERPDVGDHLADVAARRGFHDLSHDIRTTADNGRAYLATKETR